MGRTGRARMDRHAREDFMTLRPAQPHDRAWLFDLVRDERIAASLSTVAPDTLQKALDDPDGGALVIEAGGHRAGVVCWSATNRRSRIAAVHTVAIHPDHQGRGLAVTALREVARMLFDEHGFHRIEAETYGFNTAARRAFLTAG